MGEYEERYPEAYGHGEGVPRPKNTAEERRDVLGPPRQAVATPSEGEPRRAEGAAGTAPPRGIEQPFATAAPQPRGGAAQSYRGVGPRGYTRSPVRIHEDLCDRLMEDPFIDASDIEVGVRGGEITLDGTVTDRAAYQRVQSIAGEIVGIVRVHNNLRLRPPGERHDDMPAERVNPDMARARPSR